MLDFNVNFTTYVLIVEDQARKTYLFLFICMWGQNLIEKVVIPRIKNKTKQNKTKTIKNYIMHVTV